tara:strand:- start:1849 stop:2736 length:888 start_codon:yes stop_codon:yes gene_type:complete
MAAQIVKASQFSVSDNIIYTKPKINNSGGKSVGIINSMSKKTLLLQTPLMMNWGVNIYDNPNGNSYDISLQFPRSEFSNDSTDELLKMLSDFEDKIKTDAKNNSKEWFGKQNMSSEVVDALWSPMLKYPKDQSTGEQDKTRSPTLKVKLPVWEGEHKYELFDLDHEKLIPNDDNTSPEVFIKKGSNIACIIQCGGIWFANGKFGVTWKLYQGVVKPVENLEQGKCHITISTEEENTIRNEVVENEDKSEDKKEIYDSDGEDEEQTEEPSEEPSEEPVEEEAPKTKTKKNKKAVKK